MTGASETDDLFIALLERAAASARIADRWLSREGSDFDLKALGLSVVHDCFNPSGDVILDPIRAALATDCGWYFTN